MAQSTETLWTKKLLAAVEEIDRPGEFCTSGVRPAILPGLEVEGIGSIGLPLSKEQAAELKQQCEQAAYGKGEKTVVDTNVRRVWRLTPDRFKLTNPAWQATLTSIVDSVEEELGLEEQGLQPHLYDLLLYEKGGFFLPHRDGEKLDRMVATLVVVLPSKFAGGALIVRHEGTERSIEFSGKDSAFQIAYAAFYADCEHEVKPLTEGYRLCLVYNLTISKAKGATGAPRYKPYIEKIANILGDWAADNGEPQKVALTLEHQYTQDGLRWDTLKGVDSARAGILAEAAKQANCHAYLALLTFWESGSAEADYDYSSRRGRRHYDSYDDEEDSEDDDDDGVSEHTMEEVFDTSLTAEHWSSPDGVSVSFGALPIEENEILPKDSLKSVDPEEDYEGYTGNAGMTLERWYRRAAIVVWPDSRHFDVLCKGGARQAVGALAELVAAAKDAPADQTALRKERCRQFTTAILNNWPDGATHHHTWGKPDTDRASDLLKALDFLDDLKLTGIYLRDTLAKDTSIEPGGALTRIISRHGWSTFRADLSSLMQRTHQYNLGRNVRLLDRLCQAPSRTDDKPGEDQAVAVCLPLAEAIVSTLIQIDTEPTVRVYRGGDEIVAKMLVSFVRALLAIQSDDRLSRVVRHVATLPVIYPLQRVQMPALAELGGWLREHPESGAKSFTNWIEECRRQLLTLTVAAPEPPKDFRRDAPVTCTCDLCSQLNRFLSNPAAASHSFKAAEHHRSHVESNIGQFKCDVTCVTERRSRPYVLVCTKNTATHARLLKEYHENLKHLDVLKSIQAQD